MAAPAARSKFAEIDAAEMAGALNQKVKGQQHIIGDLAGLIRRQWSDPVRLRPIASLLFTGSHNTGKTELARALARYLYQSENALLQIDCSDRDSDAAASLAFLVIHSPQRVIQFYGIESAAPEMLARCTQIVRYGQMLDPASGGLADFRNSIVILESREKIDARVHPELAAHIDQVYTFQPLDTLTMAEIAAEKMTLLASEFEIELVFVDPRIIMQAAKAGMKSGMRILDYTIQHLTTAYFQAAREEGVTRVRLDIEEDGVMAITAVY